MIDVMFSLDRFVLAQFISFFAALGHDRQTLHGAGFGRSHTVRITLLHCMSVLHARVRSLSPQALYRR